MTNFGKFLVIAGWGYPVTVGAGMVAIMHSPEPQADELANPIASLLALASLAPIEPRAELLECARNLREMYLAWLAVGWTQDEALTLLAKLMQPPTLG